jgi:alpha-L-arabinofuranosidase B-like protein
MVFRSWGLRTRRTFLAAGASATPAVGTPSGRQQRLRRSRRGPCDIYAAGGTPCVAAHSTTRTLHGTYNGPLYQVRRSSDNTTRDITSLADSGVADAAAQCGRVVVRAFTYPNPRAKVRPVREERGPVRQRDRDGCVLESISGQAGTSDSWSNIGGSR